MKKHLTIALSCLALGACTTVEGGYPTAGMVPAEVTGSVLAAPGISEGYADLPEGYCYMRGPDGTPTYEANRPVIGRC